MPRRKYSKALVDASNVAHFSDQSQGKVDSVGVMRAKLEGEGYDPILVVEGEVVLERRTKGRAANGQGSAKEQNGD